MKRLVFCFDGTWNRLETPNPTNVVIVAQSITPTAHDHAGAEVAQIIHYDSGVGTAKDDKWTGGLFGGGLIDKIIDAYTFLVFNYHLGDQIFVFGFSRGAFTARAFVGFIQNCGILPRKYATKIADAIALYEARTPDEGHNAPALLEFRSKFSPELCVDVAEDAWRVQNCPPYASGAAPVVRISYLGVWDTVASLGVPSDILLSPLLNRGTHFYETDLSPMVISARHAVSIDEERKSFAPTLWPNFEALNASLGFSSAASDAPYQQRWFPGDHGSVGGGGDIRGLSDGALDWVLTGARNMGLVVDQDPTTPLYSLEPNDLAPLKNMTPAKPTLIGDLMDDLPKQPRAGPSSVDEVSGSALNRWRAPAASLPEKAPYRPETLNHVAAQIEAGAETKTGQSDLPATAGAAPGVPGSPYKVVFGDSLSKIALAAYGDDSKWELILAANRQIIDDPNRIYEGQILSLPQVP